MLGEHKTLIIKMCFRMQRVLQESASLELGMGSVDSSQLLLLLECPVCLDHITPPIKQCTKV